MRRLIAAARRSTCPADIPLSNAADLFENGDDSVALTVTLSEGATLHGAGVTDNGKGTYSLAATSVADLHGLTITPAAELEGHGKQRRLGGGA